MTAQEWKLQAACRDHPRPDLWFPPPGPPRGRTRDAIGLCRRCPVQAQCLEYALEYDLDGIWGGLTSKERARLFERRKQPRSDRKPCGTYAAYERHRRNGETPCGACRNANLAYTRDRRAKKRKIGTTA